MPLGPLTSHPMLEALVAIVRLSEQIAHQPAKDALAGSVPRQARGAALHRRPGPQDIATRTEGDATDQVLIAGGEVRKDPHLAHPDRRLPLRAWLNPKGPR